MGVHVASSQITLVKTRWLASEWHNFHILTLIDVIISSLERYLCVEFEKKKCFPKGEKHYPQKKII